MKKVNDFLSKNVYIISLGLGLIGIFAHLLSSYNPALKFVNKLTVINLSDPSELISSVSDVNHLSILSLLFLSMLIVGAFHFKKSNGNDSRLLKFGLSVIAISKIISILSILLSSIFFRNTTGYSEQANENNLLGMDNILIILISIVLFYICFYITKLLIKKEDLDYKSLENKDGPYYTSNVSKMDRFVHLIFDSFLSFLIIAPLSVIIILQFSHFDSINSSGPFIGKRLLVYLIFSSIFILYYLIFEGLFKASPLKFLTNTKIYNRDDLETPSFGKIIIRTLSRRIPFEPFSFLGANGWHDSISKTRVLKVNNEKLINTNHSIWIYLLITSFALSFGLSKYRDILDVNRTRRFYNEAERHMLESSVYNLNKGDFIFIKKNNAKYSDDKEVIVVEDINQNDFIGNIYTFKRTNSINRRNILSENFEPEWNLDKHVSIDRNQILKTLKAANNKEFTIDGERYKMLGIENVSIPIFKSKRSSSHFDEGIIKSKYYIGFDACEIEILGIEVIEGKVKWNTSFPITPSFNSATKNGNFILKSESPKSTSSKSIMQIKACGERHNFVIFQYDTSLGIYKEIENNSN